MPTTIAEGRRIVANAGLRVRKKQAGTLHVGLFTLTRSAKNAWVATFEPREFIVPPPATPMPLGDLLKRVAEATVYSKVLLGMTERAKAAIVSDETIAALDKATRAVIPVKVIE